MCRLADWSVFLLLLVCSVHDMKKKTIPLYLLLILSVMVVSFAFICRDVSVSARVAGAVLGLFFLLVSKFTKEAIGYGDSWMILLLGVYLGYLRTMNVLFGASLLAGGMSVFYLWRHRWKKNSTLPFIPFVTCSYLGVIVL